jgi:large subunit ribosomal protein L4
MAAPQAPYVGKKTGKVALDESIFGVRFNEPLVHRAVRAELRARRSGNSSTLTRGEVSMTGAKAWRQKGTGRARVGALSVPHRTGGGVAFGPKPRSYTVKINRKERRAALRSALSLHAGRGTIGALDIDGFDKPSTKLANELVSGFGEGGSTLIVLVDGEENVTLSARNLERVKVLHANDTGVADIVGAARLIASPAAIERLTTLAAAPAKRVAEAAA